MKISDRTHPILAAFNHAIKTGEVLIPQSFEIEDHSYFKLMMQKLFDKSSSNIEMMSIPFFKAFSKSYNKLSELFRVGQIKLDMQCGALMLQNILYIYDITETHVCITIASSVRDRNAPGIILSCVEDRRTQTWSGQASSEDAEFLLRGMEEFAKGRDFNQVANSLALMDIKMMLLFKKYCEIQTKFVKANSKIKDINCKYVNDTRSDITILDSTWFTTLVHSDAFSVRGHFRLQPCGEGMKERKLIWISEFQKDGYTRNFKRPVDIEA